MRVRLAWFDRLSPATFLERLRHDPLARRLASGTAGAFAARTAGMVLTMGTALLLARLLGPEQYGIYAYGLSWAMLFGQIAVLGLEVLATREIARARAREDGATIRGFARWSLALVSGVGLLLVLLGALMLWALPDRWLPAAAAGLPYALPIVLLLALVRLLGGLFQGLARPALSQLGQFVLAPALLAPAALVLARWGLLDGPRALLLHAAALLAAFLLLAPVLHRGLPAAQAAIPAGTHRAWLRATRIFAALGIASILNAQIGTVIVGTLAGPEEAAIFDLALKGSNLVAFALLVINIPLAPMLAELYARGDMEGLRRTFRWTARVATAVALAVTLAYALLLPWALTLLGPGYAAVYVPLLILCAGQIVNAACGPVGLTLVALGHEAFTLLTHLVASLIFLALGPVLLFMLSVPGFAAATALWLMIWNGIMLVRLRSHLPHSQPFPHAS